jgi:hypothetical protein
MPTERDGAGASEQAYVKAVRKMVESGVPVHGWVEVINRRTGEKKILAEFSGPNIFTRAGMTEACKLLVGEAATPFKYMALGTGHANPAAVTDTQLEAEITTNGGERTEVDRITITDNTATIEADFVFEGTLGIWELGVFNLAAVGDMSARRVFAAVLNVAEDDEYTFKHVTTIGTWTP